ncbi:septum formation family protein [Arthrobacter sp. 92]|uniref:septum formation family protein n=1 Tax=Arthrobacter sp. 92 TaxID=3418175 RepID=UPI003D0621AF
MKVAFVLAAVVVLGLIVWGVASLLASWNQQSAGTAAPASATAESPPSAQATRSQLPQEGVGALEYQLGDCFKDFDPEATKSTVVACNTAHSAQLVAVHRYASSDPYPGITALRDMGRQACLSADLSDAVSKYVLMQRNSYPSDTSWEKGDRRVDCYVTSDKGNIIMESLLP